MNRNKGCGTRNVVQAMKVQGQFRNKSNFGTSNESEQGMRYKERGTSNVVQAMKVQRQFRNKGSIGTSNEVQGQFKNKGSFRTRVVAPLLRHVEQVI